MDENKRPWGEDNLTLLDIGTAGKEAGDAETDEKPMPKWPVYAFNLLNTVTACGTLAVAKQMFNPANFQMPVQAQAQLPHWAARNFSQAMAKAAMRRVFYDMGVLMVASGAYQGIHVGLRAARGTDDGANQAIAGGLSAAFLGATFFDTTSLRRVGIWGATGALLGYYGFQERQAVRAALLERQKELEHRLMHVPQDQLHQELDAPLYRRLVQLEEQERMGQLKDSLEQHRVLPPAAAAAGAGGGDGQLGGAVAGSLPQGLEAAGGGAGQGSRDADGAWWGLLQSAPWLPGSEGEGSAGTGQLGKQQ